MAKPFCLKCGKGMYLNGIDIDPSSGLQTIQYRCFSLNTRHDVCEIEPIPAWEEFRSGRSGLPPPQARRMTPGQKLRILRMLAKEMPLVKISQKTGFSSSAIYRLKAITMKGVK